MAREIDSIDCLIKDLFLGLQSKAVGAVREIEHLTRL